MSQAGRNGLILLLTLLVMTPGLGSRKLGWAAELKEGVEKLAMKLAQSSPEGRTLRVAVTDFPDLEGVVTNLGRYIPERLTTRLSAEVRKFRVVERRRLGQVLGELGFTMSGLVDPNKAKQLGKMLGVEAIIVGTLSDLGTMVDVDARIIDIGPNRILPGVTVTISKDNTVSQMMERGRVIPAGSAVVGKVVIPLASRSLGTVKYQEFPEFRVEVEGLKVGSDGRTVTLFLEYVNKTGQELLIGRYGDYHPGVVSRSKIFVVDSAGNRYDFQSSSGIGDVAHRQGPLTLAPNVRSTATLTFTHKPMWTRHSGNVGETFSLASEQVIVKRIVNRAGDTTYRPVSTHNISILDIEPR